MTTPFNIRVMDVDKFVQENRLLQVTTSLIKEPSTNEFNPDGLFSEEIFGRIGTLERMTTLGYIDLNMKIIAPVLFNTLKKLGGFYVDLMAGRVWAVWNSKKADFERVFEDPETVPNAGTGFTFFVKYFPQIKYKLSESLTREAKVDLLNEYRAIGLYDKYLVQPAGLRDIQNDAGGRMILDDINALYASLLSYSKALPPGTTSPLYDGVKFNVQSKANEIYSYIDSTMSGKRGFMQGSYASRKVALGTRNVITAVSYNAASPDDPQALKPDESVLGVFQAMKAFQPKVFFHLKTTFFNAIFGDDSSSNTIALINPKTLKLEYQDITQDEKLKWISSDGINNAINKFINIDIRDKPLIVRNADGKPFYLMMVYDDNDGITLFRSLDDLSKLGHPIDKSKVRPLTWIEACYIATFMAVQDSYVFITRYPVLGDASCYPSKVHLASTIPGRVVYLRDLQYPDIPLAMFPEYPILGNAYEDTVKVAYDRIAGLGADYDGDTVSVNAVMAEDVNERCALYMASKRALVNTQRKLTVGGVSDTAEITLFNFTR